MRTKPIVHIFQDDWALQAADVIQAAIEKTIAVRRKCSIMLTGGTTVQQIYQLWARRSAFSSEQITYYFGDERCVSAEHSDSNYGAACRSLFPGGVPRHIRIYRMEGDAQDFGAAARRYAMLLPEHIDVLLLGMGHDGHVASLFPGDPAATEMEQRVLTVVGPKRPHRRLTITPRVLSDACNIFLLATGEEKGETLSRALDEPHSVLELPVRLALNATWLLDQAAGQSLPGVLCAQSCVRG